MIRREQLCGRQRRITRLTPLGPVNTTDASANEPLGVQGKADDAARTGRPGQEDNAAMRAERFIRTGIRSVNRP